MSVQFTLVKNEDGESNIAVFVDGTLQVASESHPNFAAIVSGCIAGDDSVIELFDIAQTISDKFVGLSERVSVKDGRVYLDGVEMANSLTKKVLAFLEQGVDDWVPLVNFFENIQSNPNEHSREMLYDWLDQEDFAIDTDGYILGYKGVARTSGGGFASISRGQAIVNGEVKTGAIPQAIGDTVEMPRSEVQWDPSIGCHKGLHVGTFDYASGFGQGALLLVRVNPRDVVSVPTDCNWAKMRCCRYTVVDAIDAPIQRAVVDLYDGDPDYGWGDGEYDEDDYPDF